MVSTVVCRCMVEWNHRLYEAFPVFKEATRPWHTEENISHVQAEQVPCGGELAQLQSAARTAAEPRKGRGPPPARLDCAGAPIRGEHSKKAVNRHTKLLDSLFYSCIVSAWC